MPEDLRPYRFLGSLSQFLVLDNIEEYMFLALINIADLVSKF